MNNNNNENVGAIEKKVRNCDFQTPWPNFCISEIDLLNRFRDKIHRLLYVCFSQIYNFEHGLSYSFVMPNTKLYHENTTSILVDTAHALYTFLF